MSTDPIMFGGVNYDPKDIKEMREVKSENSAKPTEYIVVFNNDVTVRYERQDLKNRAFIDIKDDGTVSVNRLFGLHLTGSQDQDDIHLNGCEETVVDVSNDSPSGLLKQSDYVRISNDRGGYKSKNNTVYYGLGDDVIKTDASGNIN